MVQTATLPDMLLVAQPGCVKGQEACRTDDGDMHYKDLRGSINQSGPKFLSSAVAFDTEKAI